MPTKKPISDKEICKIANHAIENFRGSTGTLNSAIGMIHLANRTGWKPLYMMFDKRTIRRAEKILSNKSKEEFRFKELFPEEGDRAMKSVAYSIYKKTKLTNFWKAVSGEIKEFKKSNELK